MDKSWDFHENMHNNVYDMNHDKSGRDKKDQNKIRKFSYLKINPWEGPCVLASIRQLFEAFSVF